MKGGVICRFHQNQLGFSAWVSGCSDSGVSARWVENCDGFSHSDVGNFFFALVVLFFFCSHINFPSCKRCFSFGPFFYFFVGAQTSTTC